DDRFRWQIPNPVTAEGASGFIYLQTGVDYKTGACADLTVGPLMAIDSPLTAQEAWIELIKPHCPVVFKRRDNNIPAASVVDPTGAGDAEHDFAIDAMPRQAAITAIAAQAEGPLLFYLSNTTQQDREVVGPIRGRLSINEAVRLALIGSDLYMRWADAEIAAIEPTFAVNAYADMSKCPCNFGFPELKQPPSAHVTVVKPRLHLPTLSETLKSPLVVMNRDFIDATRATSIADLLRHAPQIGFMRPRGHRASGAQFAELRGLESQYTLVLINGVRADASASDLMASSFDLNSIPLSAVEQVEISPSAASVAHGTDAIAGIVNIVLKTNVTIPSAEVRYGAADGGERERMGTLSVGSNTDRASTAFFVDYQDISGLLGSARDRWRNQDYTRFGGTDQRSRLSSPPTIRSVDGRPLPGLGSPSAGLGSSPAGELEFHPGDNRTSLLAYQSIAPEYTRASFTGIGSLEIGSAVLSGEALLVRRESRFQITPEVLAGYMLAADHPYNPLDVPLAVDVALTGLEPRSLNTRSEMHRAVVRFDGSLENWTYSAFVRASEDRGKVWRENFVNPAALMSALNATGPDALNLFSLNPGDGASTAIYAAPNADRFYSGGTQASAQISGSLFEWPSMRALLDLGVEHRDEFARFDNQAGRVTRDVTSAFGLLKVPIRDAVEVTLGMRTDDYSDAGQVSRGQFKVNVQPTASIDIYASYSESFYAPSLYELYLPRQTIPTQIFDPRRQEAATLQVLTGGNPDLEPTTGTSSVIGLSFGQDGLWKGSIDAWRIVMHDRVSAAPAFTLLAYENSLTSGRIVRAAPTALDQQMGLPGRLLLVDISRANFGDVDTRGVDLSLQATLETSFGMFEPQLTLTYTDSYLYSDLPIQNPPKRDRVGVASERGSITPWRAASSLTYRGFDTQAALLCRFHSSYADYDPVLGKTTGQRIPARAVWDLNLSRNIGDRITLAIGVSDLLDQQPPFSVASGSVGFDFSQADLTGRTFFIQATGSL
ncbi:MAG: TonB-dependent receptor, partial [Steroidobacter sp.]